MKMLLYGMQSSGASALAFALAQKPDSVAFVDIWNNFAAPLLETNIDTVAKVVVTTAYSLREHVARFNPDVTIVVLRHPIDNYNSLLTKSYINEAGLINEKFREMEATLAAADGFHHIVFYEDFVFSPGAVLAFFNRIGWRIGGEALSFPRAETSIRAFNDAHFPWLAGRLRYGLGSFREGRLYRDRVQFASPSEASAHLAKMCPTLFAHYETARAKRGRSWLAPEAPLLVCDIGELAHRITGAGKLAPTATRGGYVVEAVSAEADDVNGIRLVAAQGSPAARLRISGLPGAPFDRITARVWLKNPGGAGMRINFRIDDAQGAALGSSSLSLSQGDMSYVDAPFEAGPGPLTLTIDAVASSDADVRLDQTLCIEELQWAHAARLDDGDKPGA